MIPPKRILVGVDFSDSSRAALAMAARLANSCAATLLVLHAEDPLLCAAARSNGINLRRELLDDLDAFVRSTPPVVAGRRLLVVGGQAQHVICTIAAREQADLIVIGARGLSAPARLLFGSNTARVLREAHLSVLVVPADWRAPDPAAVDLKGLGPVVAGVDFTVPSLEALAAAARLARLLGAPLEAAHVVPPIAAPARWTAQGEIATRQLLQSAHAELARVGRTLPTDGTIRLRVESGKVPDVLLAASAGSAGRSPLLVLGRRSSPDRREPGSVIFPVVAGLDVPVMVTASE